MKKTIYCLVQPDFYPFKNPPSIEESIDISNHLLNKHCLTVGGFFDNRYEHIQNPEDINRDFIFRLSYSKRIPELLIESSKSDIISKRTAECCAEVVDTLLRLNDMFKNEETL